MTYHEWLERQAGSTALDVVEWTATDAPTDWPHAPEPAAIEVQEFETYEEFLSWLSERAKQGEGR